MADSLKEIAEIAGVSVSTVSRVLNGKTYVNEETRKKVLNIIGRENYHPNAIAQSLKNGASNTLCLMIPSIQNVIFAPITRGVEDVARENGYTVILCNTDENEETEALSIEKMRSRWVDGFIIASSYGNKKEIYSLAEEHIPIVLVNRFSESDIGKLSIISIDNYKAGYDATKYLAGQGFRRIAIAVGKQMHKFYRDRLEGYQAALKDSGLPYDERLIMQEMNSNDDFYAMTQALMNTAERPDVFFATSDPKAIVIMHALHDMGYKIPQDVAVLGFDNVELSSIIEPALSTVSQPLYEIGAVAARNIIYQIRQRNMSGKLPEPEHKILAHELIIRKST